MEKKFYLRGIDEANPIFKKTRLDVAKAVFMVLNEYK